MSESNGKPKRVALYLRTSTDEQADRETIQNQRDFLRGFTSLYQLNVVATYEDDGWSGTLALADRPAGRQLLEDARAKRFDEVLVYRLDRLARKLVVLLDAHGALDTLGVTIRSGTEPFDTSTPVGRLLFQLLGAIAEWERSSIAERMALGRNRVARAGKWTGGPVPLGYDVGADGCLVPSARMVPELGITEAELARDLFERIAAGSSTTAEVLRLNLAGVVPAKRYSSGKNDHHADHWHPTTINRIIHNDLYKGVQIVNSAHGEVKRPVPALVSESLWEAANRQLVKNRRMSTKNAKRQYLLRGLITCGNCGYTYVGNIRPHKDGGNGDYYRCNYTVDHFTGDSSRRCIGRTVKVALLDAYVWEQIRAFVFDPGEAIGEAQAELRKRMGQSAGVEAQRQAILGQIAAKDKERDRVLTLYRKGHITLDEVDEQMATIGREAAQLRAMAEAIKAQDEITQALEAQLSETTAMLGQLRENFEEIERTNDFARKRQIVELLVRGITVHTEETEGGKRRARVAVRFAFGKPRSIVVDDTLDLNAIYDTLTLERELVVA